MSEFIHEIMYSDCLVYPIFIKTWKKSDHKKYLAGRSVNEMLADRLTTIIDMFANMQLYAVNNSGWPKYLAYVTEVPEKYYIFDEDGYLELSDSPYPTSSYNDAM